MEFGGEALFDNLSFQISAESVSDLLKMVQVSQPCLRLFSEVSDPHQKPILKDYRIGYLAQDLDGFSSSACLKRLKRHLKQSKT